MICNSVARTEIEGLFSNPQTEGNVNLHLKSLCDENEILEEMMLVH